MTPKVNPTPLNNPPNPIPNVPADPDSDPSSSDSSISYFSHLSDDEFYKQRQHAKKNKKKRRNKIHFRYPIKNCANIKDKVLKSAYKSKVINFKLDEDPL